MDRNKFWVWLFALFFALVFAGQASAAEVVLHPGYITGTVSNNAEGYKARNISVSAYGGGYSASKNSSGDSYSLTVQAGDWEHTVNTSATISPVGASYPYTSVAFSPRTITMAEGETVVSDYSVGGTVRFNVGITGDAYTYWYAYGYAVKNAAAGEERTNSNSRTTSYTADDSWDMPVVPNDQIRVYARVYVRSTYGGKWYYFNWYSGDYLYKDIADGETAVIDLNIDHVAPPQPPPPGPAPVYDYGSLEGNVFLDLNVDGTNYDPDFYYHYIHGYGSAASYDNPGSFRFPSVRTGIHTYRTRSLFREGSRTYYLYWPYEEGDSVNNRVTIAKDETTYKDFIDAAGMAEGRVKFTGTLTNEKLQYFTLGYNGVQRFYDPATSSWVYQPTYGGSSSRTIYTSDAPDGSFRFFLTEGPWLAYSIGARTYNYDKGYYSNSQLTITDYTHYFDGNYYNFGQPTYVVDGQTTVDEREYCTGTAVIRFRVNGGGLLSSPSVSGSGRKYTVDNKPEMVVSVSGNASVSRVETPEVEIHGPEMEYSLSSIQVYAEDGSLVRFSAFPVSLVCGATKIIDINGPELEVASPQANLITNASVVNVAGTASDVDLASITVNGAAASYWPTGNPEDANEVSFTYGLPVVGGANTVTTVATDGSANASQDERTIYVDPWVPTVSFLGPADNTVFLPGTVVPVSLQSTDRGYGFNLKVYLNGALLYASDHDPVDDQAWEAIAYNTTVTASAADQVLTAIAVDLAGNSTSSSVTIRGNTPPALDVLGPFTVNEGDSVVVTASANDAEGGVLSFAWDLDNDGSFETIGQTVVFSAADLDGPDSRNIAVLVTDNGGLSDTGVTTVAVANVAPTASLTNASGAIDEGAAAQIVFGNQADASQIDEAAGFTYSYDCNGDGIFELADSSLASISCQYADNGNYSAVGLIQDKDGGARQYTAEIFVNNVAPAVGAISATLAPTSVGTSISASADFNDPGLLDTHAAVWAWGDGSTSAGVVSGFGGSGSVSGSHVYSTAGVYTVTLSVTDKDGGSDQSVFHYLVIYDPGSGFVTGGGWIDSPAGAYSIDSGLTGKANFGFVSKYKNGAMEPTGQTEFNYHVASFNFHSTNYEWLVIAGPKAQYKGSGSINGQGDYGFMLTATDGQVNGGGGVDKFRMKIWDKSTGEVVYDNQRGNADDAEATYVIGGGSIVIHN